MQNIRAGNTSLHEQCRGNVLQLLQQILAKRRKGPSRRREDVDELSRVRGELRLIRRMQNSSNARAVELFDRIMNFTSSLHQDHRTQQDFFVQLIANMRAQIDDGYIDHSHASSGIEETDNVMISRDSIMDYQQKSLSKKSRTSKRRHRLTSNGSKRLHSG
jgi:hypothetical protein